jgi:hypothetical protein
MAHPEGPWQQPVFDHCRHLKFAWTVLSELPADEASSVVANEIRSFADVHSPGRYHDTLTQFWIRLVDHTRSVGEGSVEFSAHLDRFPLLLDRDAPKKHYSGELLGSDRARSGYVEPDLRPMP